MRICIHRGAKEIGGSCVEIESQGQWLLLDLGLPLDAENNDPKYLPDIKGLDGNDPSFLGILISHPHVDHFGLLSHISEDIPVGMGPAARRILKVAAPFMPGKWPAPEHGWDYKSEVPLKLVRLPSLLIWWITLPMMLMPCLLRRRASDSSIAGTSEPMAARANYSTG